jgi:hypothetical protein
MDFPMIGLLRLLAGASMGINCWFGHGASARSPDKAPAP